MVKLNFNALKKSDKEITKETTNLVEEIKQEDIIETKKVEIKDEDIIS
jgi:hypothetical protein